MKYLSVLLLCLPLITFAGPDELGRPHVTDIRTEILNPAPETKLFDDTAVLIAEGCCKVCRKGKACGNSCISRSYTCHKGPGCACDG